MDDLESVGHAASVFEGLEAEHQRWRNLALALPHELACQRLEDKWSFVEALAHVTSWNGNAITIAFGQTREDAPDPGPTESPARILGIDVEAFNRATNEQWRDGKPQDALNWADSTHDQLLSALRKLQVERLLGGSGPAGARQWYWLPASTHSAYHRGCLEARLRGAGHVLPE